MRALLLPPHRPARLVRAALVTALLAAPLAAPPTAAATVPAVPAGTATPGGHPTLQDPGDIAPERLGDERLHPALVGVAVEGGSYGAARSRLAATEAALAEARRRLTDGEAELDALRLAEYQLTEQVGLAAKRRAKSVARSDDLEVGVRELAVARYVQGGAGTAVDPGFDLERASERLGAEVLAESAGEAQIEDLALNRLVVAEATGVIDGQTPVLEQVRAKIVAVGEAIARAGEDIVRYDAQRAADRVAVADARMTAWVVGQDFQLIVLDAYYRAAATLATEQPACRVRWQALAGIGRTESRHGTFGGTSVGADGRTVDEIIGIRLDGTRNTAVITDTDGGAWDRDGAFDRAVGPMQFIPGSWRRFGRDADGNGAADPHSIYDAALAAGQHLCKDGPGLDTEEGLRRAFFGYNRSEHYVQVVLDRTYGYDSSGLP